MLHHDKPEALTQYLMEAGLLLPAERPRYQHLPGGVSCLTILVQREQGPDFVLKQALPKLAVTEDWYADPARIHIEARAMRVLQKITPAGTVPQLLHQDKDRDLIVMEAVPSPHTNWKALLMRGELKQDHVVQFARILAQIHRASRQNAQLEETFQDQHFFETLRLEPYYLFTAREVPEAADFLHALVKDTRAVRHTLVHGDYSPKNILIHQGRLHLLDHEVMHFGDGTFDLGFSLTHLLSKARHVVPSRKAFLNAARQYWQTYREHFPTDAGWEQRAVRHTLACLLARVRGKSPLEYLLEKEQGRQVRLCLQLMLEAPKTLPGLIDQIQYAYDNEP